MLNFTDDLRYMQQRTRAPNRGKLVRRHKPRTLIKSVMVWLCNW